jgi:hypothetical protein
MLLGFAFSKLYEQIVSPLHSILNQTPSASAEKYQFVALLDSAV